MAEAGVTVIIPSLSGSSDLSSGVISGFRRALMRADGGGAAVEACPSIVSSLNDIPGRDGEMVFTRQGPESGGYPRTRRTFVSRTDHGTTAHVHNDTDCSHEHPCRPDGMGGGDRVDGSVSPAGGVGGEGTGGGHGVAFSDGDQRANVKGSVGAGNDEDLVRRQLMWRWPEFSSPAGAKLANPSPPAAPRGSYLRQRGTTDFRDFFDDEEEEAARRQQPKAYAYLGGLREAGKAKYVFDRTSHNHAEKGALAAHLRGDYEPRAKGYRGTNVHSVTDWRRPNTNLDRHASSGRDAMELVAKSEKTLKSQGVWVQQQMKAREQRRQRANHLLEVSLSSL
ncbi:unnamed protein product, partial [Hapterophycus canaliculatus]